MPPEIQLLLQQIQDPIIRENFRRLEKKFRESGIGNIEAAITNIIQQNAASTNIWEKSTGIIAASSVLSIDSINLANFKAVKYVITVFNTVEGRNKSFEMLVTNLNPSLQETVYAKIGTLLSYSIEASIVGPDMKLVFTNNEAFAVEYIVAKLVL